jgi:hypothetical protein
MSLMSQAQDYKPFNLKGASLFVNAKYDVQAIRIDSVTTSGMDTIYKNYLSAVPCFANPYGYCIGSWIGSKVIKKNNGWCYFFNANGDTVKFNLLAGLNQSWSLYTYPNKSSLKGSVASIDYLNLAAFKDSIKTILVYQFDSLGNKGALHSDFKISKANGFIKLYNIYDYPGHPQVYELANALHSELNIKNIQSKEIYDFSIGDELHTKNYYTNYFSYSGSYDYLTKKIVLKKRISLNGDSITYTDSIYSKHMEGGYQSLGSATYPKGIILESFSLQDKKLNSLPLALIPNNNFFYIISLPYDTILKRMRKIVPYYSFEIYGNFYRQHHFFEGPSLPNGWNYLEGLGGSYFGPLIYDAIGMQEYGNSLLYYKKGPISIGNPLSPSLLAYAPEAQEAQLAVSISPNPLNSLAALEIRNKPSNELFIFCLSDLFGKEVLHKEFTADKIEIERGALSPGLYLYSLKSQTQTVKTGKVVVQ